MTTTDTSTPYIYLGTPFSVIVTEIDNGKGYWQYSMVTVLRDGKPIGEFQRNYTFSTKTFHPFQVGDAWYALYSKEYTATRVARLTDTFEDWCGEERDAAGFCPVEFFVPVKYQDTYTSNGEAVSYDIWLDAEYESEAEFYTDATGKPLRWADYGFVSGCIWGDDSSWKLRYIDLSKIPDKVLKMEERFGYWELAHNLNTRQSVRIYGHGAIGLTGQFHMKLNQPTPNPDFVAGFFPKVEG